MEGIDPVPIPMDGRSSDSEDSARRSARALHAKEATMDFDDFGEECITPKDDRAPPGEEDELSLEVGTTPQRATPTGPTMDVTLPNLFPKMLFESKGKRKKGNAHSVSVSGAELSAWLLGNKAVQNEKQMASVVDQMIEKGLLSCSGSSSFKKKTFTLEVPKLSSKIVVKDEVLNYNSRYFKRYFAVDTRTGEELALKTVKKSCEEGVLLLEREAALLASLNHPSIVSLRGYAQTEESMVMITERMGGGSVFDKLVIYQPFSELVVANIVAQVAEALHYLHSRNILFGGLCMSSIMVKGKGPLTKNSEIKLVGFSRAVSVEAGNNSFSQTNCFQAPEMESSHVDVLADMYSLGVCMYCMLTGYPPFVSSSLEVVKELMAGNRVCFSNRLNLSAPSRIMLLQLLNVDPKRRLDSGEVKNWPLKESASAERDWFYPESVWDSVLLMEKEFQRNTAASGGGLLSSFFPPKKRELVAAKKPEITATITSHDAVFCQRMLEEIHGVLGVDHDTTYVEYPFGKLSVHYLDMQHLNTWHHFCESASVGFYVVDLSHITSDKLDGTKECLGLDQHARCFDELYTSPMFCEKTLSKKYNVPLAVVFLNTESLLAAWQACELESDWPGYQPGDDFAEAKACVAQLFLRARDRCPMPRQLFTHFLAVESGGQAVALKEYIGSVLEDLLAGGSSIETDVLIKRGLQLKLERLNARNPDMHRHNQGGKSTKSGIVTASTSVLREINCLAEAVTNGTVLRLINLRNNMLTASHLSSFFASLPHSRTLTVLNLSKNFIGDEGAARLRAGCANHRSLTSLIITENSIGPSGAKEIAGLLRECPRLTLLDLSGNLIGDEGVIALASGMRANRTLKILNLFKCEFAHAGGLAIADILRYHPALECIELAQNGLDHPDIHHMVNSTKMNRQSCLRQVRLGRLLQSDDFSACLNVLHAKRQANRQLVEENAKTKALILPSLLQRDAGRRQTKSGSRIKDLTARRASALPGDGTLIFARSLGLHKFKLPKKQSFANIMELNLAGNSLKRTPSSLAALVNLEVLVLSDNKLATLGPAIGKLPKLVELYLANNRLNDVDGLAPLTKLEILDVRFNTIGFFPPVWDMSKIRVLLCDDNQLMMVPPEVKQLSSLRTLSLSNNNIDAITAQLYAAWATEARIVDLPHCGVRHLPKEIGLLQNLVELNLRGNELELLPPQFSSMSNLRVLDLSDNDLVSVTALKPLADLELRHLVLDNNPRLPHAFVSSSTAHMLKTLKSVEQPPFVVRCTKVMIVGKESVGKTMIANALVKKAQKKKSKAEVPTEVPEPTNGIEIRCWEHEGGKGEAPITFKVWDFAGSEVHNTTHAFFLDERSVFLLTYNVSISDERQRVKHWLQMIQTSAPKSPVILVGTHADLVDDRIIEAAAKRINSRYTPMFSNITSFVPICTTNTTHIDLLKDTIVNVALQQPYMSANASPGYRVLQDLIASERHLHQPPLVNMEEFEQMVLSCGIDSSGQTAAELLDSLGDVCYFGDKKLGVSNSVVLDPTFLANLISTVITREDAGHLEQGILYHSRFKRLWSGYPSSLHSMLIALFNRLELAYTVPDPDPEKGAYSIVPGMLPSARPFTLQSKWISIDDYLALGLGSQLERIYQFEFLPFGFFSRLMVRLLHFTTPLLSWKTGIVCERHDAVGMVEFEPLGMELNVKVRGKDPAKLLRVIVDNINLLIDGWYNMKAEIIVPFILKGYQSVSLDHQFTVVELEEAAAEGKQEMQFKDSAIRIDSIAPDLVLADMGNILIEYGDMEVQKEIGKGGFGTVFKAVYQGKPVAVKRVDLDAQEQSKRAEIFREFRREVALSSELRQPDIVALTGVCLGPWCLVQEFMPYGDLYEYLHDEKNVIPWKMVVTMARNIADAVRFLHNFQPKIIHRDLKSPNCLMASVDPDAEHIVKLTDFGESRAVATSYSGRDRLQNPVWLAPEIMKKEQYTEKADVYSYGIMLWELVGRVKPFSEYEVSRSQFTYQLEDAIMEGLRPTIPEGTPKAFAALIEDCWQGDPKLRPDFNVICRRLRAIQRSTLAP
mmetsp:Transcript_17879/g.69294  ORF Transcript_17879/g.69294 Transcript_17879/m.69294 type:complete len:2049 (-) Transcript_17879:47-6193(-)